jgi:hypothetical protein
MNTNRGFAYNPMIAGFLSFVLGTSVISITEYLNGPYGWTDSRVPVLLGFLITFFWPINVHAYQDAYRIEVSRKYINHFIRSVIRLTLFTSYATFIHWFSEGEFTQVTLTRIITSVVMLCAWFWLLFDYFLNFYRERALTYIGKNSFIDRMFFGAGWFVMLVAKVVLFGGSVWLYYNAIK